MLINKKLQQRRLLKLLYFFGINTAGYFTRFQVSVRPISVIPM